MLELHTDISSAAAEIFTASVTLNELLHLGYRLYVMSELGLDYPQPVELEVDNAAAIAFLKHGSGHLPKARSCRGLSM